MKLRSEQQAAIPHFQNPAVPMVLPTQDSMLPFRNPLKSVQILMASRLGLDFLGQGLPEPGQAKFVHGDSLPHNLSSSSRLFLNLIDFMSFPLATNSQYPFWLPNHLLPSFIVSLTVHHRLFDLSQGSYLWTWFETALGGDNSLSLVHLCKGHRWDFKANSSVCVCVVCYWVLNLGPCTH